MKITKIEIRNFLYLCTLIMLVIGIAQTCIDIGSQYTNSRDRELIKNAKAIQPFMDAEETIQDGIRALFGTDGKWVVEDEYIHVMVERDYTSALSDELTFDILINFTEFDNMKDDELWIFQNVCVDGKKQSPEEVILFFATMIRMAMDYKYEQET